MQLSFLLSGCVFYLAVMMCFMWALIVGPYIGDKTWRSQYFLFKMKISDNHWSNWILFQENKTVWDHSLSNLLTSELQVIRVHQIGHKYHWDVRVFTSYNALVVICEQLGCTLLLRTKVARHRFLMWSLCDYVHTRQPPRQL